MSFLITYFTYIQRIIWGSLLLVVGQFASAELQYNLNIPNLLATDGWRDGDWRIRTSIYTIHYHPQPEHNNHQRLVNVEYIRDDDWLAGMALFRNSFAQPTQYVYLGKEWWLWSNDDWQLRVTVTGGLLHGYKGEYRDKIPLNRFGIAPALLPYFGMTYKKSWFVEAQFFAASGVMATVGYHF